MKKLRLVLLVLVAGTSINVALAQTSTPPQATIRTQERVFGSQLMTQQERNEYRQRMREMKTQEERDRFRQEHHARMLERAKERGVTLPEEPPARGGGAGPGGQAGRGGAGGPAGSGGGRP